MRNLQHIQRAQYDDKIRELHAQVVDEAKMLSSIKNEYTLIKSEYNDIQKNISLLVEKSKEIQKNIESLNSLFLIKEQGYKDAVYNHEQSMKKFKDEENTIQKNTLELDHTYMKKKSDIDAMMCDEKVYKELQDNKLKLLDELSSIRSSIFKEKNDIQEERKVIQEDRNRLKEQIELNSRLVVDYTQKMGLVELFAKRLQNYYDDTGVKLNVLAAFNLLNK